MNIYEFKSAQFENRWLNSNWSTACVSREAAACVGRVRSLTNEGLLAGAHSETDRWGLRMIMNHDVVPYKHTHTHTLLSALSTCVFQGQVKIYLHEVSRL